RAVLARDHAATPGQRPRLRSRRRDRARHGQVAFGGLGDAVGGTALDAFAATASHAPWRDGTHRDRHQRRPVHAGRAWTAARAGWRVDPVAGAHRAARRWPRSVARRRWASRARPKARVPARRAPRALARRLARAAATARRSRGAAGARTRLPWQARPVLAAGAACLARRRALRRPTRRARAAGLERTARFAAAAAAGTAGSRRAGDRRRPPA